MTIKPGKHQKVPTAAKENLQGIGGLFGDKNRVEWK